MKNVPTLDLHLIVSWMPPHIYEKFMQVWKFFDPSLSPILHAPETYMKLSEADLTKENMKDIIVFRFGLFFASN